jgi:hypothetical protein
VVAGRNESAGCLALESKKSVSGSQQRQFSGIGGDTAFNKTGKDSLKE